MTKVKRDSRGRFAKKSSGLKFPLKVRKPPVKKVTPETETLLGYKPKQPKAQIYKMGSGEPILTLTEAEDFDVVMSELSQDIVASEHEEVEELDETVKKFIDSFEPSCSSQGQARMGLKTDTPRNTKKTREQAEIEDLRYSLHNARAAIQILESSVRKLLRDETPTQKWKLSNKVPYWKILFS